MAFAIFVDVAHLASWVDKFCGDIASNAPVRFFSFEVAGRCVGRLRTFSPDLENVEIFQEIRIRISVARLFRSNGCEIIEKYRRSNVKILGSHSIGQSMPGQASLV